MPFTGSLYFKNSSDFMEVSCLIVREDHLAFDLTTTWGEHGKWSIDGRAFKKGAEYVSEEKPARQGGRDSLPCVICFRIHSQTDSELLLEGSWSVSGEAHEFEGELEQEDK